MVSAEVRPCGDVSICACSHFCPSPALLLDTRDPVEPFVGACCGSVNTIVEKAGAKHIFDDLVSLLPLPLFSEVES